MHPIQDPVLIFALVMVLLLLAPLLSARLRLPSMVILILAGVLVGPHGIGLLARDSTFELLGTVGLLYLMFLAGLEIDMHEFRRRRHHSLLFGGITFLLPQVAGALLAWLLFGYGWPTAILLASMFASHTLVPYPIVSRLGLSRSPVVTTAVGGTIVTDTAALLVLAVIVESHTSDLSAAFWIEAIVKLALLVIGILVGMQRLGYAFFRRSTQDGTVSFIFVLAIAFLSAYAADLAGVEPIIGAFLAGLAFSPLVPEQSPLMVRIRFVGEALFIPFFLLSVGMLINLGVMTAQMHGWWVAIFMTACVTSCKWAAATLSGRLLGYDADNRKLLFGLSVNQAAATLAAVLVGHRIGLLDDAVLNGTIMMILASCMLGPWVVDRVAHRIALSNSQEPQEDDPKRCRMLIPIADRNNASALLELALLLRDRTSTDPLMPLHVVRDDGHSENNLVGAERMLGATVVQALAAEAPVTPITRIDFNVAGGIARAARELRASTLVMGWKGTQRTSRLFAQDDTPRRVMDSTTQMLLLCRFVNPLAASTRVRCLLPPLIERHPNFQSALRRIHHVADQIGGECLLVGLKPSLDAAMRALRGRSGPSPKTNMLYGWKQVTGLLETVDAKHELVTIFTVRRGRLAWQPSLERLPDQFITRYPGLNMIVLYLSEQTAQANTDTREVRVLADMTGGDSERVGMLELDNVPLEQAPRHLLETLFPHREEFVSNACAALDRTSEPIELASGVVLMHAHLDSIQQPIVLVGLRREGWQHPTTEEPIHALFVLFSVRDQPPERHLEMLYRIASFVKQGRLADLAPWIAKQPPVHA